MTLHYLNEQKTRFPFSVPALTKKVIRAVLAREGRDDAAAVSLTLVDDERIRELNKTYRGIDAPTDVLSFPALDPDERTAWEELAEEAGNMDPETGELFLGDIVISGPRAAAQAETYGHSARREIAFLIAHSALHLLGYDHMTKQEAARMEAIQEEILTGLSITRDTKE